LRKRILIFLIAGFLIYLIDVALNPDEDNKDIYISDQELTSLITAWKSQVGRDPTDEEIVKIINNLVEEEILYREALLLGLDKEDRIIKRRLAQKITFLKQETLLENPNQEALKLFYNENKEKYFIQPSYSFTHLFFTKETDYEGRSIQALQGLLADKTPIDSDPFLLGKNFIDKTTEEIARNFGNDFIAAFANLELNKWSGPFESSFGNHLVLLRDHKEGFYPPFNEIKDQVLHDYFMQTKENAINKYINDVKSEYRIIINPNLEF
jgi:hypothetical protein